MEKQIRIGIVGYGNLGRGVEIAVHQNPDMEAVAIFTRREPSSLETVFGDVDVISFGQIADFRDRIDVMVLCGGSASDLPRMSPKMAANYNIVDSFDNHAKILEHISNVGAAADSNGNTAVVSVGWDPGLFSMNRLLGEAILPQGATHTFWGEGLSQGHSEAVRRIDGVRDAVQYTVPIPDVLDAARQGEGGDLGAADRHKRVCYVVAEDTGEQDRIEKEIKTMPDYFAPYQTTVYFISEDELKQNHSKKKHGGFVIRSGETSVDNQQSVEFSATLGSNPEFTASVLVAYARAAFHMNQNGQTGAKTAYDIPLSYLTPKPMDEVIRDLM